MIWLSDSATRLTDAWLDSQTGLNASTLSSAVPAAAVESLCEVRAM